MKNICIINRQRKLKLNKDNIRKIARKVLDSEKVNESTGINIMFVRDSLIQKFNLKYFNKNNPTDVISFPDVELDEVNNSAGDIIISVDRALEFSSENSIDLNEELTRYIVHGILHCLGYEDTTLEKKRKMFKRQEEIIVNCKLLIINY